MMNKRYCIFDTHANNTYYYNIDNNVLLYLPETHKYIINENNKSLLSKHIKSDRDYLVPPISFG
jgi:hypothetical protein